ncbi:MAG: hypothetical protein ACE5KV_08270 [Thermoplasmata archaeon]
MGCIEERIRIGPAFLTKPDFEGNLHVWHRISLRGRHGGIECLSAYSELAI